MEKKFYGRFAPTPSGFLHLGNVFCSLLAWLFAKSRHGGIVLRIEDLDSARCPRANADALARDLEWLGLTWDSGAYACADDSLYFQSNRSCIYEAFFAKLQARQLLYPCFCGRNELHAASAPHSSDGRVIYPGTCRGLTSEEIAAKSRQRSPAYRISTAAAPERITFTDGLLGKQSCDLRKDCGDFILRRSDGVYAYQLAVVIDDALMGIDQVVRGNDLLTSTPQQLFLYELLELPAPEFIHIPLLTAADGRRLAKRDGDLEIGVLRRRFGSPEPVIGLLAHLAGQLPRPEPLRPEDLLNIFAPTKIPHGSIVVPDLTRQAQISMLH